MRDQRAVCNTARLRRISLGVVEREKGDNRRTYRGDDEPRRMDLSGRPSVSRDADAQVAKIDQTRALDRVNLPTPMGWYWSLRCTNTLSEILLKEKLATHASALSTFFQTPSSLTPETTFGNANAFIHGGC